jgi:hypothetical protein
VERERDLLSERREREIYAQRERVARERERSAARKARVRDAYWGKLASFKPITPKQSGSKNNDTGGKVGKYPPAPEITKMHNLVGEKCHPSHLPTDKRWHSAPLEIPPKNVHTSQTQGGDGPAAGRKKMQDYENYGSVQKVWYNNTQHLIPCFLI